MDDELAGSWAASGAAAGRTINAGEQPARADGHRGRAELPLLLEELRKLADGRTYLMPLGISAAEEELSKETGLPLAGTTAQTCKAVNGKILSRRLVSEIGIREVPGRIVSTVGELPRADRAAGRRRPRGRQAIPRRVGTQHGRRGQREGRRPVAAADRAPRAWTRRPTWSWESWIEHAQDLNYQFVVSRTGRRAASRR